MSKTDAIIILGHRLEPGCKPSEDLIRRIVREELAVLEGERAKLPASDWAVQRLQEAKTDGVNDGTRPRSYATREEVVLMLYAAK